MTRTEYTTAIRAAGYSVRPDWQGRSDLADRAIDLTCYNVADSTTGAYVTQMIVRDCGGGLDVFFASPHLRVSDDIAFLKSLARREVA